MLIYECADFEIVLLQGQSDFGLVTFSSLGMFNSHGSVANGSIFWGRQLAERHGIAALGFVAKQRHWFCSPEMPAGVAAALTYTKSWRRVIAYGSSMGGYAALRWGQAAGADTCIVFAPQYSIDPGLVGSFDRRYEYAFSKDRHQGMVLWDSDIPRNTYMLYDPTEPIDGRHAEIIAQAAPEIHHVTLRTCGHECVRALSGSASTLALFGHCLARDPQAVRTLANAARRTAPIRAFELACRLLKTKPSLAERVLHRHGASFEIQQRDHIAKKLVRLTHPVTTGIPA